MGELSKSDAEYKRSRYIERLNDLKGDIREDFEEMDFENADQRDVMEGYIELIEAEYESLISLLDNLTFE